MRTIVDNLLLRCQTCSPSGFSCKSHFLSVLRLRRIIELDRFKFCIFHRTRKFSIFISITVDRRVYIERNVHLVLNLFPIFFECKKIACRRVTRCFDRQQNTRERKRENPAEVMSRALPMLKLFKTITLLLR